MAVYTRSHLLKSKKVIIIQSDSGALERLAVGKYVSDAGGGSRVESAEGGRKGDRGGAEVPGHLVGGERCTEVMNLPGPGLPAGSAGMSSRGSVGEGPRFPAWTPGLQLRNCGEPPGPTPRGTHLGLLVST